MMRRFAPLLLWLVAVFSASAESVRIVTWNLQWYPGRSPNPSRSAERAQIKAAKEILRAMNPDVLLLQEIRDWNAAEDLCSVLPELKLHVVSSFEDRSQNLVIASRYPADSAWFANWTQDDDGMPPRGYAFAALKLPTGDLLLTYCVHLKSNTGGVDRNIPIREEASEQLLAHARKMMTIYRKRGRCGILIGGDFNSSMDDSQFRSEMTLRNLRDSGLRWVFQNIPPSMRITIPASGEYPSNCFDHIFYSPGMKLRGVKVGNANTASDHNPVFAEIEL